MKKLTYWYHLSFVLALLFFSNKSFATTMVLYNTSTHTIVTPAEISSGKTSWVILDANNANYSDYTHPAYYNTSIHKVLDSSTGSRVEDWILTVSTESGSNSDGNSSTSSSSNTNNIPSNDSNVSSISLVLYNQDTNEIITAEEVASGSTTWLLLSPEKYPEKYTHPAFYSLSFHRVVENVEGDVEQGWTLRDPSSIDQNQTDNGLDKVLYNTTTHQLITRTEVEAGGTGWIALASGFVGNDGSTYSYPSYYNLSTHGVLDNSQGDLENGWILTLPSYKITVSASTGGSVSGGGTFTKNESVSLLATPRNGYVFVDWSGGATGNKNPNSLIAASDLTIHATFAKDSKDNDGDGLSNYEELVLYETNSSLADTDGDGLSDKDELDNELDPKVSNKEMVDKISIILGSSTINSTPYTNGWFYLQKRGWIYSNSNIYPYFYDQSTQSWLFFQNGNKNPLFYHYDTKSWIELESSSQ